MSAEEKEKIADKVKKAIANNNVKLFKQILDEIVEKNLLNTLLPFKVENAHKKWAKGKGLNREQIIYVVSPQSDKKVSSFQDVNSMEASHLGGLLIRARHIMPLRF